MRRVERRRDREGAPNGAIASPDEGTLAMTALSSPRHRNFASHHDPRRLLAAAIVGSLGVIALSVAFGEFVVASRPSLAAEGRSLLAGIPSITILGVVHLVVAFSLASGGRTARRIARVLTGEIGRAHV